MVSLPSWITDMTATLIDNIFTNNVDGQIASGLVMADISDHLPIYAFVGGAGSAREEEGGEPGEGEGVRAEIGGMGLEGAAFDERRGECVALRE